MQSLLKSEKERHFIRCIQYTRFDFAFVLFSWKFQLLPNLYETCVRSGISRAFLESFSSSKACIALKQILIPDTTGGSAMRETRVPKPLPPPPPFFAAETKGGRRKSGGGGIPTRRRRCRRGRGSRSKIADVLFFLLLLMEVVMVYPCLISAQFLSRSF